MTISKEVLKYPYCGKLVDDKIYFSEKFCLFFSNRREKSIMRVRRVIKYGPLLYSLNTCPNVNALPLPSTQQNYIHANLKLNLGKEKQEIIDSLVNSVLIAGNVSFVDIQNFSSKLYESYDISESSNISELYHISSEFAIKKPVSRDEFFSRIIQLRGGGTRKDICVTVGYVCLIILIKRLEAGAFQPPPNTIKLPHLQWLYGDNKNIPKGVW